MIEQFLTPQEWAAVWCQDAKARNAPENRALVRRVWNRIDPYTEALYNRLDESALSYDAFIQAMTSLLMLEEALEKKYQDATQ